MLDNVFNCDKCGITCQNQTALTNHKISEKTVNCGLCFKTFKNLCELYFIHSTNGACALLPVSCDTCNKRFASVAYMQKHKETSCDQSKKTPDNYETLEVSKVVGGTKQDIEDIEQDIENIEQDIEDIETDIELVDAVRKDDNLNTLHSSLEENLDEISKSIKQEIHEEGGFTIKEEPLDPSYEDQTEFESWIQNTYPKLYTEYCQTSTPTISSILPSITICAICNLGYITSFHFGINCCKKDLQFIQDTFTNNRIYTECVRMCPPKKSTWCKYCRLRKCLISGMDISLVQKNAHYGVNDQVWEDEKIESNSSVENEDVMDAEVWLKNVYPVIYVEYARQSPGIARKPKTLDDICTICSLRPNHRDWFGIRCCQSDDTFLMTTFSKRLPYQICSKLCPPRMVDWCSYCRLQRCILAGVKVSGMQLNGSDLIKAKISRSKIVRPSEAAFQNVPIVNARNDYMNGNIKKKNIEDVEKVQEQTSNEITSPILALEEEHEKSELEKWIKEAYPKIYQEYEREKRYPQSTIALSPPPSVYNFLRMIFSDQLIYDECENMCPMTLGKLFCGYCRVRRSLKAGINLSLVDTENNKSSSIVSKAPIINAPIAKESINYPIVRPKQDSMSYSMKVQDSMSYPIVQRDPLQISKYEGEPTTEHADAVSWVRRNYPLIYEDYLRREEVNFTDNPQICPICYLRPHSGLHYGIYCCEGDKQFLKRTFHEQIVYEICPVRCAPKPRGWCQYCRLRECLKSGVDLNLIRVSEARRRKQMKQKKDSLYSRPQTNKRIKYEGDLGTGQLGNIPFQAMDSGQQAQQFQLPWQMQSNSAFPQFYMQQNILVQNNIMSAGQDTVMDSNQVKEAARRGIYFKCNECEHVATTDTNLKRNVNDVHGFFNSGPSVTNNDSYSSIMF